MEILWNQMCDYFYTNGNRFLQMLMTHIKVSLIALCFALVIGIPVGYICVKHNRIRAYIVGFFGSLRVVPSLAILLLMVPVMGTGTSPAVTALVLLAVPPILTNTVTGLEAVPEFMLETAKAIGMEEKEIWRKVRFPLALPLVIAGVKTAAVEIVASATLAAKIGAGGLGELIFTGIGLFRKDLLIIGGVSVALISLLTGILFGLLEKKSLKYRA